MGPETAEVNVGLWHVLVSQEEPKTEDWLGKDIEDSVGDNLGIDGCAARPISNTPDAKDDFISAGKRRVAGMFLLISGMRSREEE